MAVDKLGPFRRRLFFERRLGGDRFEIPQVAGDLGHRIRGRAVRFSLPRAAALSPGRQLQDAERLQLLQNPQGQLLPAAAARKAPVQMLADRARQLPAAVLRQKPRRLLNLGDCAARQPLAD